MKPGWFHSKNQELMVKKLSLFADNRWPHWPLLTPNSRIWRKRLFIRLIQKAFGAFCLSCVLCTLLLCWCLHFWTHQLLSFRLPPPHSPPFVGVSLGSPIISLKREQSCLLLQNKLLITKQRVLVLLQSPQKLKDNKPTQRWMSTSTGFFSVSVNARAPIKNTLILTLNILVWYIFLHCFVSVVWFTGKTTQRQMEGSGASEHMNQSTANVKIGKQASLVTSNKLRLGLCRRFIWKSFCPWRIISFSPPSAGSVFRGLISSSLFRCPFHI